MKPMLCQKYYLSRIIKSKDLGDSLDAIEAYKGFVKFRNDYLIQRYVKGMMTLNPFLIMEANEILMH